MEAVEARADRILLYVSPLSLYLDSNLISSVEPKLTDKGFCELCVWMCVFCVCGEVHTGINFNIIITESI